MRPPLAADIPALQKTNGPTGIPTEAGEIPALQDGRRAGPSAMLRAGLRFQDNLLGAGKALVDGDGFPGGAFPGELPASL